VDSARAHLVSDVRVGAFLSGGLDSSLLVRLVCPSLQPDLPTFHVGFGDAEFDESAGARRVAGACGTDHHELHVANDAGDPVLFNRILDQFDEPFGDSSCIPVYLICREMRRHVKVVLSGDGGDEVLGGYPRYLHARRLAALARWNPATARLGPLMRFARRRFRGPGRQAEKAWRFAQLPALDRLCALHTYFAEEERQALYQPEFAAQARAEGPTSGRFAAFVPRCVSDPTVQLMTAEMGLRLHADYLRKVDVASAAHGVEVRVPYLDPAMLDLAARIPTRFKITPQGDTKAISRHLARELLPPQVAMARKQGFSIPLDRWMGAEMREHLRALLLDPGANIRRLLDPDAVRQVWDDFDKGDDRGGQSRYQRTQRLFLLASLGRWMERWSPAVP
jgi:asparagine synthase (glutamine-hydrolysing)